MQGCGTRSRKCCRNSRYPITAIYVAFLLSSGCGTPTVVYEPATTKDVPKKLLVDPGLVDCDATDKTMIGVNDLLASNACWRGQARGTYVRLMALRKAVLARQAVMAKALKAAK